VRSPIDRRKESPRGDFAFDLIYYCAYRDGGVLLNPVQEIGECIHHGFDSRDRHNQPCRDHVTDARWVDGVIRSTGDERNVDVSAIVESADRGVRKQFGRVRVIDQFDG
jgi:hypothetical protein